MKVELKEISSVKKEMSVRAPKAQVEAAKQKAVLEVQKQAKIPGFRQGKVPHDVIEKHFGGEINRTTVDHIIDDSLLKAFEETNVRPISRPVVQGGLWEANGDYTYQVAFEVLPEIKVKKWEGLVLESEEVKAEQAEVEGELKRLQESLAQMESMPEGAHVGPGHVVKIDYSGDLSGESFEGSEAKDYSLEVGAGQVLPEFEKGIAGAKVGEVCNVKIDYPADYFNKAFAGKTGTFKITVKDICKKNLPKLDDEFAKDLGDFKTFKEVEKDIQKRIVEFKELQNKNRHCDQIIQQLVEKNPLEVPESLVEQELRFMIERFAKEMEDRGQKIDSLKPEEVIGRFKPEAEFRVKGYLLLDQISVDQKLEATEEEVEGRLKMMADSLRKSLEEVRAHYLKNNQMATIKSRILHEKALEFVLEKAKIKTVKPKLTKKA